MNFGTLLQSYLPSRDTMTWLANEAVKVGFEAVKQVTPYVPVLRTLTGTLTVAGIVSTVYQIGPKRIATYLLRQEGEDRLTPREITAVKALGATALIWAACNATELLMHRNWNAQKREFTEQDYLDEAKRNLDRWVKPKMTLSDPLAPLRGDSFTEKCIEKMTYSVDRGGQHNVIADIKWDPDCWNNFQSPRIGSRDSYLAARDYRSLTWDRVPVEKHFRSFANKWIRINYLHFYIPRFLNPSWEDIPATESDGIHVYLRKPEACSMQFSWEASIGKYGLFRDVLNKHGGEFDHCDLTDRATWPDDSQRVKDFYSKSNCNWLTQEYAGRPPRTVPECDQYKASL